MGRPGRRDRARGRPPKSAVGLSAETGRLAVTPAPYGKPGGPGLYGVKSNKHSDYFEHIVQALMRKRGMDKGRASAIAWGALRKWQRGGGKVHPEVRAAATGALAEEKVAQARAHAHANTWGELDGVIELAAAAPPKPDAHQQHIAHLQHLATHGTPSQQAAAKTLLAGSAKSASASAQPRVAAGAPAGGQFAPPGSSSGSAPAKSTAKTAATPKAPKAPAAAPKAKTTTAKASSGKTAKAPAGKTGSSSVKAAAHQQHLAHVTHLQHLATHGTPAQKQAALTVLTRLGVKP